MPVAVVPDGSWPTPCGRRFLFSQNARAHRDTCTACAAALAAGPDDRILESVLAERRAQHSKWGEQNHPDGTGPQTTPLGHRHVASDLALSAKLSTDRATRQGVLTWVDILLEEVFEALAEDDPDELRSELIQIAAVAVAWVGAIDRRRDGGS